jgi:hypothetical protein
MSEPTDQNEIETLEAELRSALQHQRAAYERLQETQHDVYALVVRARALLQRLQSGKPTRAD